jgi:hypothetical protein
LELVKTYRGWLELWQLVGRTTLQTFRHLRDFFIKRFG